MKKSNEFIVLKAKIDVLEKQVKLLEAQVAKLMKAVANPIARFGIGQTPLGCYPNVDQFKKTTPPLVDQTCGNCGGTGKVTSTSAGDVCPLCNGTGIIKF